jgi:hypothetical protein
VVVVDSVGVVTVESVENNVLCVVVVVVVVEK